MGSRTASLQTPNSTPLLVGASFWGPRDEYIIPTNQCVVIFRVILKFCFRALVHPEARNPSPLSFVLLSFRSGVRFIWPSGYMAKTEFNMNHKAGSMVFSNFIAHSV